MTTIPAPREETTAGGNVTTTVLAMVNDGLREVKDAVGQLSRDMHETFSRMPNDYVPRREVERRMDEFSVDLGAERAERLAALKRIEDDAKARAAQVQSQRRWLIGTAFTAVSAATGVLGGITLHFH